MAGMTQDLQKKLLDHFFGISDYVAPDPAYLSLHTDEPTDLGSHDNEVDDSGTGYARQSLDGVMNAATLGTGKTVNGQTVVFGPALTDWGTITSIGFEDADTGGSMALWGTPSTPKTISAGQPFRFFTGQLSVRFD